MHASHENDSVLSTCTGEFGVVYRALLLPEVQDAKPEPVAVKTLKGN